ncbi:SCO0930 family lipoprotein [Streptomyces sp. NPDC094448]|uniref:SCO0930 family lipoprotein n=1 Tax=Streptomyces sp. NPDC094448 TaxID=3366063 RepID=UPI003814C313
MKTWRSTSAAAAAAALLVLTTACGQEDRAGGGGTDGRQPAGAAKPASGGGYGDYGSGAAAAPGGAAKPAGRLAVRNIPQLGEALTDSAGFTLYRFDEDTASPPRSRCEGDCAKAWSVVAAAGATAPPGAGPALLGEVTRPDGGTQLTVAGWPVYRYAGDTAPGQARGQGVGGTWFAAAPDGGKAGGGGAAGTGGTGTGGGYGTPGSSPDNTPGRDSGSGSGSSPGSGSGSGTRATGPAGLPGLSTRKDPKLGEIVVDREGMTVYRFIKDSAWPMRTACTGECLKKWPAVAPVNKNDTRGILKKGFVTFARPDGIKQQTIDCRPLYTFSGDRAPGETNGQGVGGTWFAVTPQGKAVRTAE